MTIWLLKSLADSGTSVNNFIFAGSKNPTSFDFFFKRLNWVWLRFELWTESNLNQELSKPIQGPLFVTLILSLQMDDYLIMVYKPKRVNLVWLKVDQNSNQKKKENRGCLLTCAHAVHARKTSPVKTMGTNKNGNPTTVEQKSISICTNYITRISDTKQNRKAEKNRVFFEFLAWVVSGFIVKIASCKLPKKASMINAPVIIIIPIMLKFGDIWASANVNKIKPRTSKNAEMYSWTGYFLRRPGINAPIIITGNT